MRKVDVLIIRTSNCENDPRIRKMLFHYGLLNIKVGIHCKSKIKICKGPNMENVEHSTWISPKITIANSLYKAKLKRMAFFAEYLAFAKSTLFKYKFNAIHGCDLDGMKIGSLVRTLQLSRSKRIFEIYDPWTTMVNKPKITKMENKAIRQADLLVSPIMELRVEQKNNNTIVLGNQMDIDLIAPIIYNGKDIVESIIEIFSLEDFVLVGGSIGKWMGIENLIEICKENGFKVALAGKATRIEDLKLNLDSDIIYLGDLNWETWLGILNRASLVWCYYDPTIFHFQEKLSPNKYWEALICNKPLAVSSLSRFADRAQVEPKIIEVENSFESNLARGLKEIKSSAKSNLFESPNYKYWKAIQDERTHSLQLGLLKAEILK
jgi:hypothetical protein